MFEEKIYTEEHKAGNGKIIRASVFYDNGVTTPRSWDDNLATLALHPGKSHWTCDKPYEAKYYESDVIIDLDIPTEGSPYKHWENIHREQLKLKASEIAIALPITKYEHGYVSLSLGYKTGWDYDVIGFAFVTKEKLRYEFGKKRITKSIIERALRCIKSELDTLSDWINGEVYGFELETVTYDDLGDEVECKRLDSCWGFIGDKDCKEEMQSMLDYYLELNAQN